MGFPCTNLNAVPGGGATKGVQDWAQPYFAIFSLTLSSLIITVTNSTLTGLFSPTSLTKKPPSTGPHAPLCIYDNRYKVDDSNNLPSDDKRSDMAWLGSDELPLHCSDWEQDSDGVYHSINESDIEEKVQVMHHHLPSLPPTF